ncbi:MAG: hypothetical protein LZ174_10205 [Thaumarchaeota archaeon]|jgi:hypothetical protein|nr:hypothetical protein [Candidatus Geocrenenecus arthurdayi]
MKWLVDRRAEEIRKSFQALTDECDASSFIMDDEYENFIYLTASSLNDGMRDAIKRALEARPLEGAPSNQQER